ncbi:MAG TPA: MFS transporter [Gaiellales bacterium]
MTSAAGPRRPSLAARVAGGEIDVAVRPVLGVAFLQAIVEGAQTSFLGLWALRKLGASQTELGLAFFAVAVVAVFAGYGAGKLSDRVGRRWPILAGSAGLPVFGTALAFAHGHILLGFALMVGLGASGGVLLAVNQALLTDLVPRASHEGVFASARVVQNAGFIAGPLLGALLLGISWRTLFLGTGAIALLAFVLALRVIPQRMSRPEDAGAAPSSSLRSLVRDPSFVAVLAAGTLGAMVYVSYETLLPISLVQSHGLAPTTWGFLLVVNPIVVVLFQIRLSQRSGRVPEMTRIAIGLAAMCLPFLLVAVSTALPLLVLLLLLFVLGEMLWVPPSQALVARLAPDETRGAYLGASSATWTAAFAIGPLIGLQVRSSLGDTAMWCAVAIIGVLAIALYALTERLAGRGANEL